MSVPSFCVGPWGVRQEKAATGGQIQWVSHEVAARPSDHAGMIALFDPTPPTAPVYFAKRVRQVLNNLNMSHADLAITLDMDRDTIREVLNGKGNPPLSVMQAIACAIHAPLWWLLLPDSVFDCLP